MNDEQRTTHAEPVNMTLTVDPVITWLEQIRDFMGSTPQATDMAQRAIDRLRPPAQDPWTVVAALVDDLGTLRSNDGALISDRASHPSSASDDAGYYGGYLVAESIVPRTAIGMSFLPQLLVAARETPGGRKILAHLARELSAPRADRDIVRDRLDGTTRLSRLAAEFKFAGQAYNPDDPFYVVAMILERLAAGLLEQSVGVAAADIQAWLDGARARRAGATS